MKEEIIRADGWIIITMLVCFLFLVTFLPLIALISVIIYPSFTLLMYAIFKIYKGVRQKYNVFEIIIILIFGIFGILFSTFIIILILSQPNVTSGCIIQLIAFPITIVGISGIIKGLIVKLYSIEWRRLNILIGIITIVFTVNALIYAEIGFLFHFSSIIIMVFINMIFRAGLYLSEFDLSIWKLKNLKVVLYIISNYTLEDKEFPKLILNTLQQE